MSNCGYTTETFAVVYALFDAVQKTRPRVKPKNFDSDPRKKKLLEIAFTV